MLLLVLPVVVVVLPPPPPAPPPPRLVSSPNVPNSCVWRAAKDPAGLTTWAGAGGTWEQGGKGEGVVHKVRVALSET